MTFASAELEAGWGCVERRLDALVSLVSELDLGALNWRPPAVHGNSIYVLATHTIESTRFNLLGLLCGRTQGRDREAEFRAAGESAAAIEASWRELRAVLRECLATVAPERLEETLEHSQHGPITGRGVLLLMVTHTAEHLGHAELTRDLLAASR